MKSKIQSIPLELIGILLLFGVIVDVPMVLLHNDTHSALKAVQADQTTLNMKLQSVKTLLDVTPTATPAGSLVPVKRITQPMATSAVTPTVLGK